MKRRFSFFQSIYIKIPMLFVFILLISFQFIGVYFIDQLQSQSVSNFKENLGTQSNFLINNVRTILEQEEDVEGLVDTAEQLNQVLLTFTTDSTTRIQVLNPRGYVLATNQSGLSSLIGRRTENESALSVTTTRQAFAQELHDYVRNNRSYLLIKPIFSQDNTTFLGVVMIEASMNEIYNRTNSTMIIFVHSALIAIGVAFVISLFLSQALIHPVEQIRQQAMRISEGIYNYPANVYGKDEIGDLAITVNELAVKVKDGQESIEAERQRLDGILRHMTDGVIGTDRRGTVLLINERALQLLGKHMKEAVGLPILTLLNISEQYRMKDLLTSEKEMLIYPDSDTILKGEISIIRRDTGFVTGLVCVLSDITEQEKTEQERREFVSNVSHELRTPLTSVKSYSEALVDGAWKDTTIAPQFLEVIQSEANRMIRMIDNLLDLSKIDGGQIKPQFELIDFKRIVAHILDRFEFTMIQGETAKKYSIKREFTSRELYLEIDQDRITQVIDNLMTNAIKYSPDGGEIVVKIEDTPNTAILSISDEGLGIPQKDIPHLFERFYRVDKARSREQGGTGLGLAISKEVIELHKGKIWVESLENEGSTFFVELPYDAFDNVLGTDEGWDDI